MAIRPTGRLPRRGAIDRAGASGKPMTRRDRLAPAQSRVENAAQRHSRQRRAAARRYRPVRYRRRRGQVPWRNPGRGPPAVCARSSCCWLGRSCARATPIGRVSPLDFIALIREALAGARPMWRLHRAARCHAAGIGRSVLAAHARGRDHRLAGAGRAPAIALESSADGRRFDFYLARLCAGASRPVASALIEAIARLQGARVPHCLEWTVPLLAAARLDRRGHRARSRAGC